MARLGGIGGGSDGDGMGVVRHGVGVCVVVPVFFDEDRIIARCV